MPLTKVKGLWKETAGIKMQESLNAIAVMKRIYSQSKPCSFKIVLVLPFLYLPCLYFPYELSSGNYQFEIF